MGVHNYQKNNKRINQIGICSIIVTVVIGFFIFGFAQYFESLNLDSKTLQTNEFFENVENTNQNNKQTSKSIDVKDKSKQESENIQLSYAAQNFIKMEETNNKILEERIEESAIPSKLVLDVEGKAYEVSKKLAEPIKLYIILIPTDNNLKKFKISSTIFTMGENGVPVDYGVAKIEGKKIIIDFTSHNSWMPDIVLNGILNEEILKDDDNTIGVIFQEQQFFLSDGDTIPTYVNLKGIVNVI